MSVITDLNDELTWFNFINKIKEIVALIDEEKLSAIQSAIITPLGATTNLSAISASYADLDAARASVNTLKTEAEVRLDNIEAKVDALIAGLKTAGVIATS